MKDLLSLLPIVAIFLIFWLLVIRPASRRQKEMREVQKELRVGDAIVTNSGFFGTVARLVDDKVGVEIADGVVVTMARAAVVGVVTEEHEAAARDLDQAETDEAETGDSEAADSEAVDSGRVADADEREN